MEPFTVHTGTAAPLRRGNVDTDQIIPARYLKRVTRTGFADGLFAAWRADPDFELNQASCADASILVAGPDFGTGSSREHAVWALQDGGFRVVIAARFGDIFRSNAGKCGLLAAQVDQADVVRMWQTLAEAPDTQLTVDLVRRQVRVGVDEHAYVVDFHVDDHVRQRLLRGIDDISATLAHEPDIASYEAARPSWRPTTQPERTGPDTSA